MSKRKRYAQIGLGGRHETFRDAVIERFAKHCEMVGLCDINQGRLKLACDTVRRKNNIDIRGYQASDYDKMIQETRPDCVIVTTMDAAHDFYICRALELGCDVLTEKPMTIDESKCRRILKTQRETGKKITVTFNYRYSPPRTQIKDLLMQGVIGEVLSVDFHWMLDTSHGADYFRRWHRNKQNSGGLIVHKATHHFDLVNWWLSTEPKSVYALGQRRFYVPETAKRYGLTNRGERCHGCPESKKCRFNLDLEGSAGLRAFYLDCEQYDGYHRDQCVFSDKIDIEDSMNLVVEYRNGTKLTYSLNAFSPWEGYHIAFNGTGGRLEHKCEETAYINADGTVPGALKKEGTWIRIYPHFKPAYEVDVWEAKGGHGGGDDLMVEDLFCPNSSEDQYKRISDQRAGAWSIITGIAANHSMAEERVIHIEDLLPDIELNNKKRLV